MRLRARPRAPLLVALLLVVLLPTSMLAAACGSSDEPPITNPLDDRNDTATPGPTGTGTTFVPPFAQTPTTTPDPDTSTSATPGAGTPAPLDEEALTGAAIEVLAEWTGAPASLFAPVEVAAVDWPNSCLGVQRPDIACAEVITPGYRLTFATPTGSTHEVHTGGSGQFAWAPQETVEATVTEVDPGAGHVSVMIEGQTRTFRAVPGAALLPPLADLDAGASVSLAYDQSPTGDGEPVLVWLVE
ncbi:MAG: hypothetical protein GEU80_03030 [Dehalococcoidia bacterium]|nr:hypothetical protein [Dehalococcoidia bacterium]